MGLCTSCMPDEDFATVPLEVDPSDCLLIPPPPPRTQSDFDLPRSLKGSLHPRRESHLSPHINDYPPLDHLTLTTEPCYVSVPVFFSLLQQKTVAPHNSILYDLQGRRRYNKGHLKFAANLYPIDDDPSDISKILPVRQSTIDRLNREVSGKILLLYSIHDKPQEAPVFENTLELIAQCIDPPRAIIILDASFHTLCTRYPHAHMRSTLPMPGVTEVLYAEGAFNLYLSDVRAVRANADTLMQAHDIRTVLCLCSTRIDSLEGLEIVPMQLNENIPSSLIGALKELHSRAYAQLPILIVDENSQSHALHLGLLFLVLLGFNPPEAIDHLSTRKCFPDTLELPQVVTQTMDDLYTLTQKYENKDMVFSSILSSRVPIDLTSPLNETEEPPTTGSSLTVTNLPSPDTTEEPCTLPLGAIENPRN